LGYLKTYRYVYLLYELSFVHWVGTDMESTLVTSGPWTWWLLWRFWRNLTRFLPMPLSVLHSLKVSIDKALLKQRTILHVSDYSKGSADNLPESSGELLL
jgi:hypothetical protein